MRIGEIAVVSPHPATQSQFIRSVCTDVELNTDEITVGRLPMGDDVVLHLYGITATRESGSYSWDLVFKKMLGYVMVFDWFAEDGLAAVTGVLDLLTSRYDAPLVIAADVEDRPLPTTADLVNGGISLSLEASFVFCRANDARSVRGVLATLVNAVLAKLE